MRLAVVPGKDETERRVEFQQRSTLNGTYKLSWDVGASGYIDSEEHKDPDDPRQLQISPWQTCVDELALKSPR